jgi:heme exporter protein C
VFAVLSRYAVNFWNQGLHQGASVMRAGAIAGDTEERVSNVFAIPLFVSMAGFFLLFLALVLLRTRTEIRSRRIKALLAKERAA